jgi:hypothetical protein
VGVTVYSIVQLLGPVGAQSESFAFVQPAGQHPSPLAHAVIGELAQTTLHWAALPIRTSLVHAFASSQLAGQFPSQVSPLSTTPSPHIGPGRPPSSSPPPPPPGGGIGMQFDAIKNGEATRPNRRSERDDDMTESFGTSDLLRPCYRTYPPETLTSAATRLFLVSTM